MIVLIIFSVGTSPHTPVGALAARPKPPADLKKGLRYSHRRGALCDLNMTGQVRLATGPVRYGFAAKTNSYPSIPRIGWYPGVSICSSKPAKKM